MTMLGDGVAVNGFVPVPVPTVSPLFRSLRPVAVSFGNGLHRFTRERFRTGTRTDGFSAVSLPRVSTGAGTDGFSAVSLPRVSAGTRTDGFARVPAPGARTGFAAARSYRYGGMRYVGDSAHEQCGAVAAGRRSAPCHPFGQHS